MTNHDSKFFSDGSPKTGKVIDMYSWGKMDGQDNLIVRILNNWQTLKNLSEKELQTELENLKDVII